jgi:hypothetical protein
MQWCPSFELRTLVHDTSSSGWHMCVGVRLCGNPGAVMTACSPGQRPPALPNLRQSPPQSRPDICRLLLWSGPLLLGRGDLGVWLPAPAQLPADVFDCV